MVDGAQFSVVLLSCGPGYAFVQEGLYCLGLNHPDLDIKRNVWPIIEFLGVRSLLLYGTIYDPGLCPPFALVILYGFALLIFCRLTDVTV